MRGHARRAEGIVWGIEDRRRHIEGVNGAEFIGGQTTKHKGTRKAAKLMKSTQCNIYPFKDVIFELIFQISNFISFSNFYVLTWLRSFISSQCSSRISTTLLWPFLAARCNAVFPSLKLKCQIRYFKTQKKVETSSKNNMHLNTKPFIFLSLFYIQGGGGRSTFRLILNSFCSKIQTNPNGTFSYVCRHDLGLVGCLIFWKLQRITSEKDLKS